MLYSRVFIKLIFDNLIFFTNTDTTVGFISKNSNKLYKIKNRDKSKPLITVCSSNYEAKQLVRIPNRYKKLFRNSHKTTFVFAKNNISIRVIKDNFHLELIKKLKTAYSTSANISNQDFNLLWAKSVSDVIVYNNKPHKPQKPSSILKLYKKKIKKLR